MTKTDRILAMWSETGKRPAEIARALGYNPKFVASIIWRAKRPGWATDYMRDWRERNPGMHKAQMARDWTSRKQRIMGASHG